MSRILTAVCFTFCVVCATVAKSGIHAGKELSMQNEECMNISIKIILPVYLPIVQDIKLITQTMVSLLVALPFNRFVNPYPANMENMVSS